jgi:hypothetical protein
MAQITKTFLSYNGCLTPSVGLVFSHNLLFCLLADGVNLKYDSSENINHWKTLYPTAKIKPFLIISYFFLMQIMQFIWVEAYIIFKN